MIRLRYDVLAMVRSASCEPGLRINSNEIKLLNSANPDETPHNVGSG